MPYLLFFLGTVWGIVCMDLEFPMLPVASCLILFLFYLRFANRSKMVVWLLPLCVGIVLGTLSGIKLLSADYLLGDSCSGYVLKEYARSVSIRVDNCSASAGGGDAFYVSCEGRPCPDLYSRVKFVITQTQRLGRFIGKGKFEKIEKYDRAKLRVQYYQLLSSGNKIRRSYFLWLNSKLPSEQASLTSSMLFGDTELPESLTESMKRVGLVHIIAISGVNITYLLALISTLTDRFRKKVKIGIEVFVLLGLFLIVGEAVSLIRAIIMSFLTIFTKSVGLRPSSWAFFAGLAVVLFLDPNYLWDAGFLLVSGACVGIYLGGDILQKYLKEGMLRAFLQGGFVWICVAPMQLFIFGAVTVIGLFLGFVLGPVIEALTLFGYLSFLLKAFPYIDSIIVVVLGVLSSTILLAIELFHD